MSLYRKTIKIHSIEVTFVLTNILYTEKTGDRLTQIVLVRSGSFMTSVCLRKLIFQNNLPQELYLFSVFSYFLLACLFLNLVMINYIEKVNCCHNFFFSNN